MAGGVNEKILKILREKTKKDKIVGDFLEDLLFTESEHPGGRWWFKSVYLEKIEDYVKKMEEVKSEN